MKPCLSRSGTRGCSQRGFFRIEIKRNLPNFIRIPITPSPILSAPSPLLNLRKLAENSSRFGVSTRVSSSIFQRSPELNSQTFVNVIRSLRPLIVMIYVSLSVVAIIVGYVMHPTLLHLTAILTGIKPSVDDFESSFFGLLSIVYSVFAGQTFLFLFERQINIVQELYGEIFALELLVQQTFFVCECKDLKAFMASTVRAYMRDEVYTPTDMSSPFSTDSPYMDILRILLQMQGNGLVVKSLVDSCRQLADAQSRRSAAAAQILPAVHWIFLHGMELIFIVTFLIFDASELDMTSPDAYLQVPEERRLFFGALFGILALTTQVLKDLDDPISGLYAFRSALDKRVEHLESLLVELETQPPNYIPEPVYVLHELGLIGCQDHDNHHSKDEDTSLHVPKMGSRRRRGHQKRPDAAVVWNEVD